jgi:Na+/proline symporter
VPGLAAVAVLVGSTGYLAVQVLAAGRLLEAVLGLRDALGGWSLPIAMGLGLVVVLAYSAAGGMVAGVATDVFQGALMTATAIALFVVATRAVGGWSAAVGTILADDRFGRGFLDPIGGAPATTVVGFLFVFGVGVLGQPHMLHKFMMIEREDDLRFMPVVLGGAQSLCLLVWIGLGLAVPALVASGRMAAPPVADDVVPAFLIGFAPDALAGLAVAGALAAILSTADSFVNLGSAAIVRDLPRIFGWTVRDELRRGRLATVALGVGAGLVAWAWDDLIALLGGLAFGTFAAALAPVVGVGLSWPRVSARVAAASIATGIVVHLVLEGCARIPAAPKLLAGGASAAAVALAGSFLTLVLGAALFPDVRARRAPPTGAGGVL